MWCRSRWNLEWQVGGTKQESNTSIKAIANKLLSNATTSKEALKSIHAELREGNESWLKLSTMASTRWQQPLRRHRCLGKRQQDLDSHLHHHHLLHTSSTAGGTISDSDVWNARLCLQLCGCTAHTIGIVDIYAPSSNCGSSGVEWATTATFGSWWLQMNQEASTRGRVTNTAPPRKQTFQGRIWMSSVLAAFTMLEDSTADSLTGSFQSEFEKIEPEGCQVSRKGNNSFEGADLWLCLTEAAAWVCVARRIGFIASRFTQLQPRVQSRAAESQKERIASHLNLIASHLNWIANHLNAWMYTFSLQKPSKKQQKLSVQSCLHKLCRKPLSGHPVLFAEAVQLSCRSCA